MICDVALPVPRRVELPGVELRRDALGRVSIQRSRRPGVTSTNELLDALLPGEELAVVEFHSREYGEWVKEPAFREAAVRQALAPAHYVVGIERNVRRASRTRLGTDEAEKLGPLDALRRYLASKNTSADRELLPVERAEQLLREEIEGADV